MRGYYCLQPRVWRGERLRRESEARQLDPYAPSSPDYGKRMRETGRELAPGMTLISLGEPIKTVAGSPQPVAVGQPEAPAVPLPEPAAPAPVPAVRSKAPAAPARRSAFTRDP